MKWKDRVIYARMKWDKEEKKKKVYFNGSWGAMAKSDANATAIKTGDGLVVVDIDTKDLDEIDKKLRSILKKLHVTVETARGYHYYFKHKNSSEFVNKSAYSELVDVRSDGGIVFSAYRGKSDEISYTQRGAIHDKMPKALRKCLLSLMQRSSKKVKSRVQWEEIPKGEIHDGTIRYALKDIHNGFSYDEVIANGLAYVEKYLGGSAKEIKMMMERVKWAYDKRAEDKLEKTPLRSDDADIGGDFEEEEVLKMLQKAQKGGAMELQKVMTEIKKKLKLSMATMREMLKESPVEPDGLNAYFKGELIWDSALGLYAEVRNNTVIYYSKQGFIQTCMSKSGYLESTDVNALLCKIPHKFIIYNPMLEEGEVFNKDGDACVNVYRRIDFGKKVTGKRKKWKTINRVLDNLFHNEPDAKEEFVNWMASIVQIGHKTGVAWGFFGSSGTGKGLMVDVFAKILGHRNCSLNVGDTDLSSNFNPYAHNVQFIHLNEIASDFHGRHGVAGSLKCLVSDPFIRINQKGISEVQVDNFANLILNSNKPNPLELDPDDRRWNMIVAKTALVMCDWWGGNKSYEKAIDESYEFGQFLMDYKCDLERSKLPMEMSQAKQGVIDQTSSTLQVIGKAMLEKDLPRLLELFETDANEIYFTEKIVTDACTSGKWSNAIIAQIYMWATGKDVLKGREVNKFFVTAHLGLLSEVWKVKGQAVRGIWIR